MKFIGDIKDNLSQVDSQELEGLYSAIFPGKDSTGIYLVGELGGRSLQGLKVGARPLSSLENTRIYAVGDSLVPGENILKVMEYLGKVCDKSAYICVSGSGNSIGPYNDTKRLTESNENKKVSLNLITSSPDSKIGKILREKNGNILKLNSRKSRLEKGQDYIVSGLLEDEFELGVTQLMKIVSDAVVNNIEPENLYGYYKRRLNDLEDTESTIERLKETVAHKNLLDGLENPAINVISCGQGVCNEIAKMNNNRLGHIRPLTIQKIGLDAYSGLSIGANRNYVLGESSTPNINKNTVLICISQSGTGMVEEQIKKSKELCAEYYIITKEGDFPEENVLRIESNNFYPDACFLLSSTLMDLGIRLVEAGVEISDEVLRRIHINDKLQ